MGSLPPRDLVHLSNLRHINVTHCPYVNDFFVQRIASSNLQSINLAGTALLTDQALFHLSLHAHNLKSLNLSGCPWVTDSGLASLSLADLTVLNVSRCLQATDAGLIPLIRESPNLEKLVCDSCFRCSDALLKALSSCCQGLTHIDLKGVNISDLGMEVLARGCPQLQHVGLSSCTRLAFSSCFLFNFFCFTLTLRVF